MGDSWKKSFLTVTILSAMLSSCVRHVSAIAGSHQQLPKYAPSSVTRAAKSECAPYLELATAYSKSDEAVSKVITQHAQTFQEVLLLAFTWQTPGV